MFFMKQLIILIIIAVSIVCLGNNNEYIEIPSTSIRMRVIGASNSDEDQKEKRIVKSFVEEKLYELLDGVSSEREVEEMIEKHKSELDNDVVASMRRENIKATYNSKFGYNYFPEKEFKGSIYKAGNYKSFVVTLGDGEGENWWCVLYPPLCLIDDEKDDLEYHSLIKDTIEKYN